MITMPTLAEGSSLAQPEMCFQFNTRMTKVDECTVC